MHTPENKPVTAGSIIAPGAKLAAFIGIMVLVVSLIHQATRESIAGERKRVSEQLLYEIAGPGITNLLEINPDHYQTRDSANRQGQIFKSTTQSGYNGEISLWVGIDSQGQITGVRVIEHRETPGLGDLITLDVSDWILGFNGKSLHNPPEKYWKVKKDGGEFDQFTGATITPRALVNAVHDTLLANYPTDTPSNE